MNRRHFLHTAAASLACTSGLFAEAPREARLTLGNGSLSTMPLDFTGLSYESPQLANPAFFSAANTGLVAEFRKLGPAGVLRIGGNLSDFTFWQGPGAPTIAPEQEAAITHAKTYFEWILVDPIARKNLRSITTPEAIHTLRSFLDVTGWSLLYGINFGSNTPEQAAIEAETVQRIIGPKLLAFQIGNECDFFGGSRRPRPWDFAHYWPDYQRFVAAIRQRIPNARFGGPDVAVRNDWVVDYAKAAKGDAILLSKHHYAMGPAGNSAMNAQRLLGPDDDLTSQLGPLLEASRSSGIPCRMTEINSCFHGGQPGVSDGFASALWGADFMLQLAQAGIAGVNLHGGGVGIYSPIVGDTATGYTARPLAYGMAFAQKLAGATFLPSTLNLPSATSATAYVARKGRSRYLAVINKSPELLTVQLAGTPFIGRPAEQWILAAPALDSLNGVTLDQPRASELTASSTLKTNPYTAILLRYE